MIEGCPIGSSWSVFDGFVPAYSGTFHIHGGDANPKGGIYGIHGEISFPARTPEAWVFAIELRKWELREASSWVLQVIGIMRSWVARSRKWWTRRYVERRGRGGCGEGCGCEGRCGEGYGGVGGRCGSCDVERG